jgi:hypothetical protein
MSIDTFDTQQRNPMAFQPIDNETHANITTGLDIISNALAEHVAETIRTLPPEAIPAYQLDVTRSANEIEHATKHLLFWCNRLLQAHKPR